MTMVLAINLFFFWFLTHLSFYILNIRPRKIILWTTQFSTSAGDMIQEIEGRMDCDLRFPGLVIQTFNIASVR
ncbi:hypothetical protein L218DRAFT_381155 [Marasmius fiardii PR-910]|nr:hypothetical protein L218DRAFT_381155 [Marasmius fiardii PR-910]